MDQIKVGAFLKHLRKEKGITQEKLSEELGGIRQDNIPMGDR